jgi:hypothetical protein
MRVDLSGTDAGFDALPSGRYVVKVTDGELRTSGENAKHTGSEYINWELTVQTGEYEGRKVWQNTPWSHGTCECGDWKAGALIGLKSLLTATGIWTDEQLNADDFDFEIDEVIGADVKAVVALGEYQGEATNNVKRIKALTEEDTVDAGLMP